MVDQDEETSCLKLKSYRLVATCEVATAVLRFLSFRGTRVRAATQVHMTAEKPRCFQAVTHTCEGAHCPIFGPFSRNFSKQSGDTEALKTWLPFE